MKIITILVKIQRSLTAEEETPQYSIWQNLTVGSRSLVQTVQFSILEILHNQRRTTEPNEHGVLFTLNSGG
jgi:hypothetical protein